MHAFVSVIGYFRFFILLPPLPGWFDINIGPCYNAAVPTQTYPVSGLSSAAVSPFPFEVGGCQAGSVST